MKKPCIYHFVIYHLPFISLTIDHPKFERRMKPFLNTAYSRTLQTPLQPLPNPLLKERGKSSPLGEDLGEAAGRGCRGFLLLLFLLIAFTGCEKKWDQNGDLDGMWQLVEWKDKDGKVKATKEDMIFYSFQLQMASFRKQSEPIFFIRTSMKMETELIRIYDPIIYKGNRHDEIQPMSILSAVGVPEDGIMRLQTLTGSKLVLRANNEDILTFRKY